MKHTVNIIPGHPLSRWRLHLRVLCAAVLLGAILIPVACSDDASHNEEDGHDHATEEASRQLLLYGAHTEWFIEYSPLVRGEESRWLIHLSRTADGAAVDTATVSVRLRFPDGKDTALQAARLRRGIFEADVRIPGGGPVAVFLSVQTHSGSPAPFSDTVRTELPVFATVHEAGGAADPFPDDWITFTKEEAWNMEFTTAHVRSMRIPGFIRTTGHVMTNPEMEAVLPSMATGVLAFTASGLVPGRSVRRGEVLATVSGSALTDDNLSTRIADARAAYENALAAYERTRTLLADSIMSERDFLDATLRMEQTRNAVERLGRDVVDGKKVLRAPQSGYIKRIMVENGGYVREGDPVFVIARNDRVLLKAEVYQQDYARLPSISGATFRTATGEWRDVAALGGQLKTKGRAVDATAFSVPVYFELDGASLVPGEFVDVVLQFSNGREKLVVPPSALTEDLGRYYVFVQRSGERYEKREVSIEAGDGLLVPILAGLREGERVVTSGLHALRLAASGGQVDAHGHEH